jgi:outer membrane protein assembly complex protein YaeT
MNSDLNVLRAFYRGRGFEYVDVRLDKIERDSLNRRVQIHICISEGQRMHVGEVTVVSDRYEMRPSEMRRLATKPGVPLIHQNVRQDARDIRQTLGRAGFLAASVVPSIEFDSVKNLAHVTFNVTEGPKAEIGKIELEGNRGIADVVLKRELAFRAGDTLRLRAIQQSERRLYGTGLFSYVQIRPDFDTTRNVAELPDSVYNVQVRVNPTEFFSLQGGAGYGTDEGGRLSSSATYRNVFGLGQGLTLGGKISQISQSAEAIYAIPRLFYLPFQFDTKLYYNRYDNAELYQGVFEGIRVSLGRQTDFNFLYQVWSQWEEVRWVTAPAADNTGPAGLPDYPTQSIGGDISYDMRNDLFNPTKGGYTHLGVEVAGVFGGQSNRFVKLTLDNRVYFSRRSKYFLSMALRTGWVTPYGVSEVVPVQSQFYGGGSNTVRGFPVNRLAELPSGDPLKGNFYVFANIADVRFPLFWWINGAVFLDAGNVWPDFKDVTSAQGFVDDLRWTAGPGLRVDTPIKLVARLDLGFKLDRRPGESKWELHFDLGQPF